MSDNYGKFKIKKSNLDKPDAVIAWIISWGKLYHENRIWITIWRHSLPTIELIQWDGKY